MHSSRGVLRRHKRNLAPFTLILILSELYADIYIYTELICIDRLCKPLIKKNQMLCIIMILRYMY